MRRTVLLLVASVVLLSAAEATARPVAWPPGAQGLRPWSAAGAGPAQSHRRAAAPAPCDEVPGALCDRVAVPLDRDLPDGASIEIFHAVFPHTDATVPAEGTIFVTFGGPGVSATQAGGEGFVDYLFGPLRERRDVVLIDYRGTGLSQAIVCEPMQQGPADWYAAFRACGEQLGSASDLYGSDDVAQDLEAVRAALGVERFDFYGFSYAGADAQAYAVRYPDRLGRVVLDSPVPIVGLDPWWSAVPRHIPAVMNRVCRRSQSCRRDQPDARAQLRRLIERVRRAPVSGTAVDSLGDPHAVLIDEPVLLTILAQDLGGYSAQSELAAAARALRAGDRAPLLRLGAERLVSFPPDPPEIYSAGLNAARYCSDAPFPWDPAASPAERRAQYAAARDALDPRRFAPFSVDAWLSPPPLAGRLPDPCIEWPAPTHTRPRPVPDGASAPGVPALVLAAEYDLDVPPAMAAEVRGVFPDSELVEIGSAGHVAIFSVGSECAVGLVQRFLATGDPGDASCAPDAPVAFPGVGRFPRTSSGLRPAQRVAGEAASTRADRRVAAAAAAAVTDAFRRVFIAGPTDHGQGLRGGDVEAGFAEDDSGAFAELAAARFVADVGVTGRAVYDYASGAIDADLAVSASGGSGQLRVSGVWYAPGATTLRIDGQLGGRRVVAEVPAT